MNRILRNAVMIQVLTISFVLIASGVNAQDTENRQTAVASDSLSLDSIIVEIIATHPTVKSAEEALNNADARISLAKTGHYPQVDLNASVANIGPVIKLTIPDLGTFQLYPDNNYSASVNYRQVLFDFGRTRQNLLFEEQSKTIGEQALENVKQKISLAAVNNFYAIAYLQEALKIKDEQIITLGEHLKYVERMKSTGAATDYQILSTQVKISTARSQRADLSSSLEVQQSYLCSLLGKEYINPVVKKELKLITQVPVTDSLLDFAYRNRDEIKIDQEKESLAGLRYELIRLLNRPSLSFMASGGAKNGYIPDLGELKPNYSVGFGLSVPLFDGMRTKFNLLQAQSAIKTANLETEITRRNITTEVKDAEAYLNLAGQKIMQFSLQLEQANRAYELAETSFKAGTVTNLELLDANTSVSESRLMLLKARIDYSASVYRLKAALGERLY